MLPFDEKPWAKMLATCVIAFTVIATAVFVILVKQERSLDWGERAIVILLLITVIPPNVAIIRRHSASGQGSTGPA